MAARARERGLDVEFGRAEDVPLDTDAVDLALALGVLGYVDDVDRALAELARIVEPGGDVVVAFLRAGGEFAELYEEAVERGGYPADLAWENPYPLSMARRAAWRTTDDVQTALRSVGFTDQQAVQTLTRPVEAAVESIESPTPGHDGGSWVVVRATRSR
ncbi:methylase involved in ubiquinone/menaquinone biosynthesis [Halanaeroarchaeum sulfurireducens]|uniref:Methylase involved in ubiquinone/menaquinone biosynthesis n=2 Tax=Halanaeroarchaeum sulfurireducens TaxID=1604004 RepID=A0A0F7P6I6_9EURY|nr:methylase involved in ubiquinone/menaquinone biosynthesis [Halanaeroarchaeum sulfurireducens]ALG81178.1 methylase involved in ubiquinone/menaquinone biosynthesis [Halanaeroarchaeum sulfurireducens]